jgi:hypothetical protein
MVLISLDFHVWSTRVWKKGKYGRHSLVGNYFDCVGDCCVDYLVGQKKVMRGEPSSTVVYPSYVGKLSYPDLDPTDLPERLT